MFRMRQPNVLQIYDYIIKRSIKYFGSPILNRDALHDILITADVIYYSYTGSHLHSYHTIWREKREGLRWGFYPIINKYYTVGIDEWEYPSEAELEYRHMKLNNYPTKKKWYGWDNFINRGHRKQILDSLVDSYCEAYRDNNKNGLNVYDRLAAFAINNSKSSMFYGGTGFVDSLEMLFKQMGDHNNAARLILQQNMRKALGKYYKPIIAIINP